MLNTYVESTPVIKKNKLSAIRIYVFQNRITANDRQENFRECTDSLVK